MRLDAERRRFRIVVELTKASIWLVVVCYGATLWYRPSDRAAIIVGVAWLIGLVAYIAHVLLAFAAFYGWSWSLAWQATADDAERLTGVRAGWGLWMNIAFGLAWAVLAWNWFGDTLAKRRGCAGGETVSRGTKLSLHAFLFFMVIMGGVIFAPPVARYFTVAVLVCVGLRVLVCLRRGVAVPS